MRLSEAVRRADMMRPNTVPDQAKRDWLMQLEAEFAEMMEEELTLLTEQDDPELLMPSPHDVVYHMYLAPFIDMYQEEMELWQMDSINANQAVAEAKAWYRRNNQKETPLIKGVFI